MGSETDMCKAWEDQRKEDLAFSRSAWSLICRQKNGKVQKGCDLLNRVSFLLWHKIKLRSVPLK